jgi:hypothetical protein
MRWKGLPLVVVALAVGFATAPVAYTRGDRPDGALESPQPGVGR